MERLRDEQENMPPPCSIVRTGKRNICRNLGRRRFWHVGLFEALYLHIICTVTSVLFWEHRQKGTSGSSAVATRGSTSHWPVMWPLTLNNHMLCKAGKGRYCEKFILRRWPDENYVFKGLILPKYPYKNCWQRFVWLDFLERQVAVVVVFSLPLY